MSQYDTTVTPPDPARARRSVKVAHLVLGSFFLGIAALWALAESGNLTWQGTSYLVPLTLLIAGAIGLAASLVGNGVERRRRRTSYAPAPMGTGTYDVPDETEEEST